MNHRFAKLAACAAFSCLSVNAFAQALDFTPDASRILSDPTYLPLAGQVYGDTAYTHTWLNGSSYNYAGDKISDFHINTNAIDQYLGYGITDDLTIDGSVQVDPSSWRDTNNVDGRSTSLKSSGFTDPTFGATWRALDQNIYPASLDLFGSYSPNWVGAQTASTTQDGTVARGGESGTVGAAIGHETRDFTIRGAFTTNFYGDSSGFNLSNGDETRTSGSTNYVLSLATQTRLTDTFAINAGVNHTFTNGENAVNTTTGVTHFNEPGDLTALQIGLNYQAVPNQLVLAATYAYEAFDDSKTSFANPLSDTETRNHNGSVLGVRLDYATP